MIKALLFLALSTLVFASSSHHQMEMKSPKHPKVYYSYKLVEKSTKPATAVYLCTCGNQIWKQDASKVKACPYCGPAMPQCGDLIKILPKRGADYDWSDYDLPNKVCPISGELIENDKHGVEVNGNKILLCCKSCVKKFNKLVQRNKGDRVLKKLPLKPEKFGFSQTKTTHNHKTIMMDKANDHSTHNH